MTSQRFPRTLLTSGLRTLTRTQVRHASSKCANCTCCNERKLSLAATARQQLAYKDAPIAGNSIQNARVDQEGVKVTFGDGNTTHLAYVWLRDNCQCQQCFSQEALGRKLLLTDLNVDIKPLHVQESSEGGVLVKWSDGHNSVYSGQWLYERAFTPTARALQRNRYALRREPWGADHLLKEFDYNTLLREDEVLLDWMQTMEKEGAAMIKNSPEGNDIAGPELIEHIAFVKQSHYGPHSPVINRPNTNNVAFTNAKLGMHNDLPQYEHMPGIIFIHCVQQHIGTGGESIISDGLHGAELLRRNHPEAFQILTSTDVYFWDKGHANYEWEMKEFYKISKMPIIKLNNDKEVVQVAVNNAIRDSYLDLPANKVKSFYTALKLFNDILYDNAATFKMDGGDIMTLDNVRCLHGREGYEAHSSRHIESSYLDWDEARCRRRRLQEKFRKAAVRCLM